MERTDKQTLGMAGMTPEKIMGHALRLDVDVGVQFDFNNLKEQFAIVCRDFNNEMVDDSKSRALGFATFVLFTIGPETRSAKKRGIKKAYKMEFVYADNNKPIMYTLFVATTPFENSDAPPKVKNNQLLLTVEQACLLSTSILSSTVGLCLLRGQIILTPLASAIFSKNDIKKIVADITPLGYATNEEHVIKAILESCQNGGQYLEHSQACIAVAAAICATQLMENWDLRLRIIAKKFKEYHTVGKQFDHELFKVYALYATGGIPSEFLPELRNIINGRIC